MDALHAATEHLKDGISGAQIMNSNNIVLDLATAEFLLGLCERNIKLTRTTSIGITKVHYFGGNTVQQEITDYVEQSEVDYTYPKDERI